MLSAIDPVVRFRTLDTLDGHCIGVATLDQPKSLNALSLSMIQLLDGQLREWQGDDRVVAVWLDSSSDKAFCAGADLRAIYTSLRETSGVSVYVRDFFAAEYRLDYLVHTYSKPVSAWLHGITMGGGIGLGCGASIRFVTEGSQFAMPEISIGLFPDVAGSWFLGRIPGRIGRYLGMTGARLTAADVLFAGLADIPVRHARKLEVMEMLRTAQWGDDVSARHAIARRAMLGAAEWMTAQDSALAARFGRLSAIGNSPTVREAAASIQQFAQEDPWAQPHAKMLAEGSPTSAALAWELQARLRFRSLADVFRAEYAVALGCCAHGDFAEGIRALIVDKDRTPRWKPSRLDQITNELIEDLMRPHWSGSHPLADLD